MNKKSKKSDIKIIPINGRFFDIKPPEKIKTSPFKDKQKDYLLFFIIAITIIAVFSISNTYYRGKDITLQTAKTALLGYDYIQKGINSFVEKDLESAESFFKKAEVEFKEIKRNTHYLTANAESIENKGMYLSAAGKLADSGVIISKLGQEAVTLSDNASYIIQKLLSGENKELIPLLYKEKSRFNKIFSDLIIIQQNIQSLNKIILPSDIKNKIKIADTKLSELITSLNEINSHFPALLSILGDKVPHRYLILLQNNHELRATGGFIGSYMIIDVNDGIITKMEAKDIYETDGQLTDILRPPTGISSVAERWYMRDANYSPDFPVSAEQVMWFLEHSNGPSADTVIAIDQDILESALNITGPIHSKNFPFQVRADNFNKLISFHTESKISKTATPKQLLFDLIPVIKKSIANMEDIKTLSKTAEKLIKAGHIQIYSKDGKIQALSERLNIDGKMISHKEKTDFLAVVTTNIGGNKSDQYIHTNISHKTEIAQNGSIVDAIYINKKHTWSEEDFAGWQELADRYGTGALSLEDLRFIQGKGENVDYMRLYVPRGSKLVATEGVQIEDVAVTEDLEYTVFAFIFGPISAGTEHSIRFTYELPYKLTVRNDAYSFTAQKQAGAKNITLKKTMKIPDNLTIIASTPPSSSPFSISPSIETEFNQDWYFEAYVTGK